MNHNDLERLSKEHLVELVLKLQRPPKTSRTSSKPPSNDKKERRRNAKPGGARPGHKGHFRSLSDDPDETVAHRPDSCPACLGKLDDSLAGEVVGEYDEIELPPITPFVRRHLRLTVTCPHCRSLVEADLPSAATGSPFGRRLHAYSAQQNHGLHAQTCLAHLARDVAYGLEASDDDLPFRLKLWLDKLFALARNIENYAASTLEAKKRQAENALADILRARPACDVAEKLRAKFARASPRLLTFLDFPGEVEVTNNACERALRPAVIQRKVTNGFRSMWAAEGDCAVRTVTDTAKLSGKSPYQTIIETLA
jgi:transposase